MRGTPSTTPSAAGTAQQHDAPALTIDHGRGAGARQAPVPAVFSPLAAGEARGAPALDIDRGREAAAARISALADAALGAAEAETPRELAAVLQHASSAALPCDGFHFATYDGQAGALLFHEAFPAAAAGDDDTALRAVRERRPQAVPPRAGSPAVLAAPALADGQALGVLVVTGPRVHGREEARVLQALAAIAGSALARLRLVEEHRAAIQALHAKQGQEDERTRELARANDALAAEVEQHRAAREELLQRTLELEVIFRALPDLYFRLTEDGTILSYRAGAENGLYVPPEAFLNRRMQDVLPPAVGVKFDAAVAQVRATGQVASME